MWDFDLLDSDDFFYHEDFICRGLEGWNKFFKFFTDAWDTGHFVFATACAVNASKLLPHVHCAACASKLLPYAQCARKLLLYAQRALANWEHNFTWFYTILFDLLSHAQCTIAIGYHMLSVELKGIWKNFFFCANSKSKIVASVQCAYASKNKIIRIWPTFKKNYF